jgi:hypothetical protein
MGETDRGIATVAENVAKSVLVGFQCDSPNVTLCMTSQYG